MRRGDWKILYLREPFGVDDWQLYNLAFDPAEVEDLAPSVPEKLSELIRYWNDYAQDTGVILPEETPFGY